MRLTIFAARPSSGRGRCRRVIHAAAREPAVATGILREVLLVVFLGVVEVWRVLDLRGDRAAMRLRERRLVRAPAGFGRLLLRFAGVVDSRAVLSTHVAALAHALRRV